MVLNVVRFVGQGDQPGDRVPVNGEFSPHWKVAGL